MGFLNHEKDPELNYSEVLENLDLQQNGFPNRGCLDALTLSEMIIVLTSRLPLYYSKHCYQYVHRRKTRESPDVSVYQ